MNALQTAAQSCLFNCGGVIDGADTTDGQEYVMVRRKDFDALQYAMAEKIHLLGPVFVNSPRYQGPAVGVKDSEPDDMMACLLENGNVWWYPVKDVKRAVVRAAALQPARVSPP